jgi:hypothetical protein
MRTLYRRPSESSTPVFIAVNLDPKVDVSIELCFLEYHNTGTVEKYEYTSSRLLKEHLEETYKEESIVNYGWLLLVPIGA